MPVDADLPHKACALPLVCDNLNRFNKSLQYFSDDMRTVPLFKSCVTLHPKNHVNLPLTLSTHNVPTSFINF